MSYGMGASHLSTIIHKDMMWPDSMEPVRTKAKKPWQKGFIPTVGKKPELPAPVLGGEWQFRERSGNQVEYQLRSEDPFSWGWPRIKGDLLKRQWAVVSSQHRSQVHDESVWQERVLFTSASHKACVVFVALDPDLTPPAKIGIDFSAPMFKTQTGRIAAMAPAFQNLPNIQVTSNPIRPRDHQLEYYRGLIADYCAQDVAMFSPGVLAELDKPDNEPV
ncbi:hypothetical protein [Pseudomonas mediterranea]|uniref:hypothetical protein n=1 Tax=Pseudomonas mediterranea TaxID=183795 RepID=UPI000B23B7B2|nr:hypothetical protein [Pseudomonas mediterranea]